MKFKINETLTIVIDDKVNYKHRLFINGMRALNPYNWIACDATGNDGKKYTAWYYDDGVDAVDYSDPTDVEDEKGRRVYDRNAIFFCESFREDRTITLYFETNKVWAKDLYSRSKEDKENFDTAKSTIISIEFPKNSIEAKNASVEIALVDKENDVFDWRDVSLSYDDIERFISAYRKSYKVNKKKNMAYWDVIDGVVESFIKEIAEYSATKISEEVFENDLIGDGISAEIRDVVINYLKEKGGEFPYVDENY